MESFFKELRVALGPSSQKLPMMLGVFLAAALLDVISVGLVCVGISVAIRSGSSAPPFFSQWFSELDPKLLVACATLALVIVFVSKSVASFFIQRKIISFAEEVRRSAVNRLLERYLFAPYEFHLTRNSSSLVLMVGSITQKAASLVSALMRLICDAIMALAMFALFLWINPLPILGLFAMICAAAFFYQRIIRVKINLLGAMHFDASKELSCRVQQGMHSYKEVKLFGVEREVIAQADSAVQKLAHVNSYSGAVQQIPKLLIECVLVSFCLVVVAGSYLYTANVNGALALLAALGVAGFRLLPAFTSSLNTVNQFRLARASLSQLAADLQEAAAHVGNGSASPVDGMRGGFKCASLEAVSYNYPGSSDAALKDITLRFCHGEAIGLIGRSGAGKSTLIDLLIGLLEPSEGSVRLNGVDVRHDMRSWMNLIAYVPQTVNILDDTLARNVAFGLPDSEVSRLRVRDVLHRVQLSDLLDQLPNGLDTRLGERGVRLSGGQRQRVALARALYHRRQIIVMDEATSALDTETELEIVSAIRALHGQVTLVIIAHRNTTLAHCDRIFRIEDGRLVGEISYRTLAAEGLPEAATAKSLDPELLDSIA